MSEISIYKGDDTGAFGNCFLTIKLKNPLNYTVKRAKILINNGCPDLKAIEEPVFPIRLNLTSSQTKMLRVGANVVQLLVWDEQNRPKLCKGSLTFYVANGGNINYGCR